MALLRSLFASKKFLAMLSGLIVILALKVFKVAVDPATVAEIVALIGTYIVGQGLSDSGKGAAQVSAIVHTISPVSGMSPDQKATTLEAIKNV